GLLPGLVDHPHAAAAQLAEDFVALRGQGDERCPRIAHLDGIAKRHCAGRRSPAQGHRLVRASALIRARPRHSRWWHARGRAAHRARRRLVRGNGLVAPGVFPLVAIGAGESLTHAGGSNSDKTENTIAGAAVKCTERGLASSAYSVWSRGHPLFS